MSTDTAPRREGEAARDLVGRLAPSPTGLLHLGHAHTFIIAWWHLRSRGGKVRLRLEDLDAQRCSPSWADATLRDLEWLGLDWDGPVWLQSDGVEDMRAAVRSLLARDLAYPCVCRRSDLRAALSAPHRGQGEVPYPGTCRSRKGGPSSWSGGELGASVRFRVPPHAIEFEDDLLGPQSIDVSQDCGDFVIARRDGTIAYQLAVVIDDSRQGVTEVHRGSDLLGSTPRQWLLQNALGLPHPRWIHLPLVVDRDGRRLAKRADDVSLASLRARGVSGQDIVAWVARSAGLAHCEGATVSELVAEFQLASVTRADVPADPNLLLGQGTLDLES